MTKKYVGNTTMFILLLSIMITGYSCSKQQIFEDVIKQDYSILFVGNSLTYTNDLPKLVKEIGAKKGIEVRTHSLALPNYALVDHLADGDLQKLLLDNYDFVVVQQGPSSQKEGHDLLIEAVVKIKDLCTEQGSKLAIFMVWPSYSNYDTFNGVITNYTEAATTTSSILCPVGQVWKDYIDKTADLSYYGPDLFHPSLKGSKVAAEIICKALFE